MCRKERENLVKDLDRTDVLHSKASTDRGLLDRGHATLVQDMPGANWSHGGFKQVKRYNN